MSIADEYVMRAEECERLAAECVAESNRALLLYAARSWRRMAEEEVAQPEPQGRRNGSASAKLNTNAEPAAGRSLWGPAA